MAGHHQVKALETVSCSVCRHEVPRADALSAEGQEYLYFFCGQGCYQQWQESRSGQQGRKNSG